MSAGGCVSGLAQHCVLLDACAAPVTIVHWVCVCNDMCV